MHKKFRGEVPGNLFFFHAYFQASCWIKERGQGWGWQGCNYKDCLRFFNIVFFFSVYNIILLFAYFILLIISFLKLSFYQKKKKKILYKEDYFYLIIFIMTRDVPGTWFRPGDPANWLFYWVPGIGHLLQYPAPGIFFFILN